MKRALMVLVSAALLFTTAQARQTSKDDAERLLKAAQNTEVVDGDPGAAIKQYQAIVDRFSKTERATAATALLRMADCYRKLGDEQEQRIYQRLVRDYADQPAASSQARARLTALSSPMPQGGPVQRRVLEGQSAPYQYGGVSRDGRWLLYTYNFGNYSSEGDKWGLHVRDLSSGTSRKLIGRNPSTNELVDYRSALSLDNQRVAYSWLVVGPNRRMELRTIAVNAPEASPRVLVSNDDITWIAPHDWTPDGKWIAVDLRRRDNTRQIGLVSTINGEVRVLKSVNWESAGRISLSPDGRYLAFGMRETDDSTDDIYVLATDGSGQFPAAVWKGSDSIVGWSEDGTQLLFLSNRTGSFGVWSQPFAGRPSGEPKLIRPDVGARDVIGLTAAGALYYVTETPASRSDLKYASLDLAEGRVLAQPVVAVEEHVGTNHSPRWSHDGRHLAYLSQRQPETVLVIRSSVDNRIVRESPLRLTGAYRLSLRWAPDDRSLTVDGLIEGRLGVFRIDAQTGRMTPVVRLSPGEGRPRHQWSADGKTLYFLRDSTDVALIALDVASNTETDILRAPRMGDAISYVVTPDDRTVYFTRSRTVRVPGAANRDPVEIVARDIATGTERTLWDRGGGISDRNLSPDGRYIVLNDVAGQLLMLVPTNGDEPRPLMTSQGGPLSSVSWSADGRALIVRENRLPAVVWWFVPVDGREPKKLMEWEQPPVESMLHPDGQRLVFHYSTPTPPPGRSTEVWVVENLLSTSAPAKK